MIVIGAMVGLAIFGALLLIVGLCQAAAAGDEQLGYNDTIKARKHRAGWDEGWQEHFRESDNDWRDH